MGKKQKSHWSPQAYSWEEGEVEEKQMAPCPEELRPRCWMSREGATTWGSPSRSGKKEQNFTHQSDPELSPQSSFLSIFTRFVIIQFRSSNCHVCHMSLKFIYLAQVFCLGFQTHLPNCLLCISMWISDKQLVFHVAKKSSFWHSVILSPLSLLHLQSAPSEQRATPFFQQLRPKKKKSQLCQLYLKNTFSTIFQMNEHRVRGPVKE